MLVFLTEAFNPVNPLILPILILTMEGWSKMN
jgi:hypothetical protein